MREVFVLGIGQTMFGKTPQYSAVSLGMRAARTALDDAGIDPRKIQVAYGSRAYDANTTAQAVLQGVGIGGIEMVNVENACASGSTAVHLLWKDIATGVYDVGIAVGTESLTTSSRAGKLLAPSAAEDLDGALGVSMPSHLALITRRMMETTGATMEDIVYPSVKNHRHACLNPYAQYRKLLTAAEIINSRMISDPITLLQCCPFTDGAAAVVMCSEEIARRHTTRLVRMATSVLHSAPLDGTGENIVGYKMLAEMANMAYERANLSPEDIDLVELHDAFSPEEIWCYEDLMLCPKGEAVPEMRRGTFDIGGRVPVNPSGGLLSLGHPLGASGVRTVVEVAMHLRREAGERQTGATAGLSQMVGGYVSGLWPPIAGGIQILTS